MGNIPEYLAEIAGSENVFTDPADLTNYVCAPFYECFQANPVLPIAAVRPVNESQVRDILLLCAQEKIQVCFRGGGTWPGVNTLPSDKNSLVILTEGLNRILDIDLENRIAVVQAGARCANFLHAIRGKGLFYPPASGAIGISTIGGNIAVNASVPNSIKYGVPANYIHDLGILTTSGEKLRLAAHNSLAGNMIPAFPLANLFCGSMGALAFISRATLKLLPLPGCRKLLAASFPALNVAARGSAAIMESRLLPSLLEIFNATAAIHLENVNSSNSLLLIEFDGHENAVAEDVQTCEKLLAGCGAASIRILDPGEKAVEKMLDRINILPAALGTSREQLRRETFICPPSKLPTLLEGMEDAANKYDVKVAIFGQGGIARIKAVFFCEDIQRAEAAARDVFTLELVLNNAITSESDTALTKRQWLNKNSNGESLSENLQKLLDPADILASRLLPGQMEKSQWP